MKKLTAVLCALLAVSSFAGCSGSNDEKSKNNDTQQQDELTQQESTENASDESTPQNTVIEENNEQTEENRLAETYWNATGHYEYLNKDTLVEWTGENYSPSRFADVYFYADGTALFRDVEQDRYIYSKHYKWTDDGETIRLENLDKENWGNEFFVEIRDGVMYFEAFECILRMEKAERPLYGSEYCTADLYGIWKLTSVAGDNGMVSAKDKGLYSVLDFRTNTTEENGYGMYASFMYEDNGEVTVSIEDTPLIETAYKDIRFASDDGMMRYEVTFIDDNTLGVSAYDHTDGNAYSDTVSMIYKTYPVKEQFTDKVERHQNKVKTGAESIIDQSERDVFMYNSFMEWDVLVNEIVGHLRSTMTATDFEDIKFEQMAWAINRQSIMDKEAEGAQNPIEAAHAIGCKVSMDRCYELIEYIK